MRIAGVLPELYSMWRRRMSLWRWVWLAIGVTICAYGIFTGGGLAGLLLSWELEKFGSIDAGYTHLLLLLVFVVPPIVALAAYYKKRPGAYVSPERRAAQMIRGCTIAPLLFFGTTGAAWLGSLVLPSPHAAP